MNINESNPCRKACNTLYKIIDAIKNLNLDMAVEWVTDATSVPKCTAIFAILKITEVLFVLTFKCIYMGSRLMKDIK